MTTVEQLKRLFAEGKLVDPAGPGPTLVDLSRALHSLAGAKDIVGAQPLDLARGPERFDPAHRPELVEGLVEGHAAPLPSVARLKKLIGPAEHLVFVLMDGLGVETLSRAPAGGFLQTHLAAELRTVWPSTTAAALTALATGEYPAQHAVPGWWLWLDPPGVSAEVLPFVERFGRKSLTDYGVKPEEVFTVPSIAPRFSHDPLAIMPADIAGSCYTRYCSGHTPTAGYKDAAGALDLAARRVGEATRPSFTHVYFPHVDHMGHEHGVGSPEALKALRDLDALLGSFHERLAGRARLVVTGDHGLVDIPPERTFFWDEGEALLDHLRCPPEGESTEMFLHVKPDQAESFRRNFDARWGEHFALLSTDEAEALGLYGPGKLSKLTRARVGDFVAFGWHPAALYYRAHGSEIKIHHGAHAGMSPAEMMVPLILA